jgi:hypothetical protein
MAFKEKIADPTFDSVLEIPTSGDPSHNAMLTITLRYKLNLADAKNPTPGIIVQREGVAKARDGEGFLHSIDDWDDKRRDNYKKAVWRAEKIWNLKFMLAPPLDYDGLDFNHPHPGWKVRPNVMCLFRMECWGVPHLSIHAVRPNDPAPFVNNTARVAPRNMTLDDQAPWRPTLGHELGHALGMRHIKAMLGDARCTADDNANRCYGETEHELANIMGSGRELWPLNAQPWLERIEVHTGVRASRWTASLNMKLAPQVIGTGSSLLDI